MDFISYHKTKLKEEFVIKNIFTIHYLEYTKDFKFTGEAHDFWEFLYVDKGEINVIAGDTTHRLQKGEVVFHQPNEYHNVFSNGVIAPNIAIVSFECKSKAMQFFKNKVFHVTKEEKNLLSSIIKEGAKAFSTDLNDPYAGSLTRREDAFFGAEQMILLGLQQFLLSLYRSNAISGARKDSLSVLKERMDNDIVEDVIEFLNENIGNPLCFDDVLRYSKTSGTGLKMLFKEKTGMGVMQYFNLLKIDRAKMLIREDNYNFTQIAGILGYDSIHYFSKQFKKITQMTPSEYASSVKIVLQ
ncbi:MAG: helix-turn-helix domain-containing protein [Clostridia bacterium]|nr:helix-turn-helix domain-containing protein [Clostridia bacterium]